MIFRSVIAAIGLSMAARSSTSISGADGTLEPAVDLDGGNGRSVATRDFNGDGRIDIPTTSNMGIARHAGIGIAASLSVLSQTAAFAATRPPRRAQIDIVFAAASSGGAVES